MSKFKKGDIVVWDKICRLYRGVPIKVFCISEFIQYEKYNLIRDCESFCEVDNDFDFVRCDGGLFCQHLVRKATDQEEFLYRIYGKEAGRIIGERNENNDTKKSN